MHDGRLRSLLADLFRTHGFDVTVDAALEGRSGSFYTAPVLAENGDYAVLVERTAADETVSAEQVETLANVVEDIGAEQGLLVHLGPLGPNAEGAGAGRVVLWDRDRLCHLVGDANLHAATGLPLARLPLEAALPIMESPTQIVGDEPIIPTAFDDNAFSLFDSPLASPEPTALSDAPAALDDVPTFGGFDFDAFESLEAPTPPARAPAPAPTPMSAPASPPKTAYPVLSPRVSAQEAAQRVRDRLYVVEQYQLVLQPVHVLDYECDLLVEGSLRYDTVAGRLEVHGTRKDIREVDPNMMDPRTAGMVPDGPFHERTLRVSVERAIELSRNAITQAHTRVVEIETTDSAEDVCFTERKQVAPRPDHIRLNHLGTVHRPQWQLRGPNGTLLVDALTGEAVTEELRSADPGVVMLD